VENVIFMGQGCAPPQSKVNLALRPRWGLNQPVDANGYQTVESTTCHHQINKLDGICRTNL
jgi:hypothetical protein